MNKKLAAFKKAVRAHYHSHKRDMPWRTDTTPYAILVSEIMLQQTQVSRVIPKFASWMKRFPTLKALAKASTKDVLAEWSGLGYNRRALYLKRIAEHGTIPHSYEELRKLPGIGANTAGAILAYAFNAPHPFIETNIRSAYIHFFFGTSKRKIPDTELMPLIEATLDHENPREWHWALMDYGAYIKSMYPNPSRRSVHHTKQSAFKGSNRELRAQMLRHIMKKPATFAQIINTFAAYDKAQVDANLRALEAEGFLSTRNGSFCISR